MKKDKKKGLLERYDDHIIRARCELPYLLENTENPMHCRECKERLSFLKMIVKAVGRKKGAVYKVKCKHCGHVNDIVKGEIGAGLDKEFKNLY